MSAAVALETLSIYEERDIVSHVRSVMGHFQNGLQALAEHPLVGEARGLGLLGGIELVEDKASKKNFAPNLSVGPSVAARCLEHGLIVRSLPGDIITLCPPLVILEAEVDMLLARLRIALDEIAIFLRK